MKIFYKFLIVITFLPLTINSQTHQVYKESFDSKAFETLNLDLKNLYILIEKSDDNKVHFDYTIEFKNYSEKEIKSVLRNASITGTIEYNELKLKSKSDNAVSSSVYSFENPITFELNKKHSTQNEKRLYRKSKQFFLNLEYSYEEKAKNFLKNINEIDDKGKKKKINTKNIKILKTNFIIKVPDHLKYFIITQNSNLNFNIDLLSPVTIRSENSSFKFKKIAHPSNSIHLKKGKLSANTIEGGNYFFDSVKDVKIVEINSVKLKSEFSDLKIGEIGSYVEIEDFNSKFWIHNFKQDFGIFKMKLEYSEINIFYPENSDYTLKTFGHSTKHISKDLNMEIPPRRENVPSQMLKIESVENAPNIIDINTEHSIIRFGDDYIDLIN